jgi:hypothetical protein
MWQIAVLLAAGALFMGGLAAVLYVAYRFLLLSLTMDSALHREISAMRQALMVQNHTPETTMGSQLKSFISERLKPTEGDFVVNTDEELFVQEQLAQLQAQGFRKDEAEAFMRQAVTVEEKEQG